MRGLATLFLVLAATVASVGAQGARIEPSEMTPLISAGYEAIDPDERGMWQSSDKIEVRVQESTLRVMDEDLNAYVYGIIEKLLGESAKDVRLYIMRDPNFNASMFPNGMMIVNTGLLARMRNEAQLAAVLGHEAGHYYRLHSLTRFRNMKTKTAIMSVISIAGGAATGSTGNNWYDIANTINSALFLSVLSYSRKQESEADAYGVRLLAEAGYSPIEASNVWGQLIEERKASAKARDKRYKDRSRSQFSTHPPTKARMADLALSAHEVTMAADNEVEFETFRQQWLEGTDAVRWSLLEEQVKLNDDGASIYLINSLAQDGWESGLYYYLGMAYTLRGREGDEELAAQAYAGAVESDNPLPQAYRAHGYAQMKQGNSDAGRQALAHYLTLNPDAADAAMIRFSINQ